MDLQPLLEGVVRDEGVVGITAEVALGDRTWFGASGSAERETPRPRSRREHIRIGSITKAFTSTLALTLAGDRTLTLDDSVERWLPGLVAGNGHDGDVITVRHLLGQTSGVFNYSVAPRLLADETGAAFLEHRNDAFEPGDLVRAAVEQPAPFAPGARWEYSNTNYILVGMIIEAATGRPFAELLAERITVPLGLVNTFLPENAAVPRPHARNYTTALVADDGAPVYDATVLDPSKAWTAGGLISTLGDLNRFFAELLGGRILGDEQQRELTTMRSTDGGNWIPNTRYGLGVYDEILRDGTVVRGGAGAITGTWTLSTGTPDGHHRLSANLNSDWGDVLGIFTRLAEAEFSAPE